MKTEIVKAIICLVFMWGVLAALAAFWVFVLSGYLVLADNWLAKIYLMVVVIWAIFTLVSTFAFPFVFNIKEVSDE